MWYLRAALILSLIAAPALARPVTYILDAETSLVAFETDFGDGTAKIRGRMPIVSADLTLDFDRVANSVVNVEVSASRATTSNPLATEAMRSARVLDVRDFPAISFRSTRILTAGEGAEVTGDITIRGVTRPVTFQARFYRQKGTEPGNRDNLAILLTGAVDRNDFGASGFPDMVGPEVRLKILARINRGG
jgi:polyisoprenoid-binding protein YceI